MPFETIQVQTHLQQKNQGTGVSALLKKLKSADAQLSFNFREQAMESIGWAPGDKIIVQVGSGEHHGLVRLLKGDGGSAELKLREAGNDKHGAKEQLLEAMRHDMAADDERDLKLVDVYVHKIRKKLNLRQIEIETVWGAGYKMTALGRAKAIKLIGGDLADAPEEDVA